MKKAKAARAAAQSSSWARGTVAPEEGAEEPARRPSGGPFLPLKGPCAKSKQLGKSKSFKHKQ